MPRVTPRATCDAGDEYSAARASAEANNKQIRNTVPDNAKTCSEIHEIQPMKVGGSPTDPANKIMVPKDVHNSINKFWTGVMKDIQRWVGGGK